jgi:hypothetical protein
VVRFLNGRSLTGEIQRFDPKGTAVRVRLADRVEEIATGLLKAIFFLRDTAVPPVPETDVRPSAKKVRVEFADGEVLLGYTYGLHPLDPGFFLFPIQKSDSNERIFVIRENAIRITTEV